MIGIGRLLCLSSAAVEAEFAWKNKKTKGGKIVCSFEFGLTLLEISDIR